MVARQNSAAPINARALLLAAKFSAGYRKQEKIWSYRCENWRRTGAILAATQLDDGQLPVQAVMNNDLEAESVFRVRDDANTLHIAVPPRSLLAGSKE